jgi:hypothetical protein
MVDRIEKHGHLVRLMPIPIQILILKRELPPSLAGDTEKPLEKTTLSHM